MTTIIIDYENQSVYSDMQPLRDVTQHSLIIISEVISENIGGGQYRGIRRFVLETMG